MIQTADCSLKSVLYWPTSEDLSPQSPDSVLGLVGNIGSKSDFGRIEGISPLCLLKKKKREKKTKNA